MTAASPSINPPINSTANKQANNLRGEAYKQAVRNHVRDNFPESYPEGLKNGFANTLGSLPQFISEPLVVGNFVNGLGQCLQEALTQLLPRAGTGMLIRKTPLIGADESVLELLQYLLTLLMPTALAASFSKVLAKVLGLQHNEILGRSLFYLEKSLGEKLEVGTINKKELKISKEVLGKVAVGKLAMFGFLAVYCFLAEFVNSGLKVLLMNKMFDTSNFYTISGLSEKTEENKNDGHHALKNAIGNLKKVLITLPLAFLSVLATTSVLGRNRAFAESKFTNKMAKIFDFSDKFAHPKTLIAVSLLTAGLLAYPNVARNQAEKNEVRLRILFFSAPMFLFFKQIVGNFLSLAGGLSMGLGNILAPVSSYFKEVGEGSRNIFDLGLVGIQKNKDGSFSGRVLGLEMMKKLKHNNEAKYNRALKRIHFMDHRAPYWMALLTGIGVSWLNYIRTAKLQKEENEGNQQDKKQNTDRNSAENNLIVQNLQIA